MVVCLTGGPQQLDERIDIIFTGERKFSLYIQSTQHYTRKAASDIKYRLGRFLMGKGFATCYVTVAITPRLHFAF